MDSLARREETAAGAAGETMRRTVAVVDMVGYSEVAKLLEENMSVGGVASLNRQIQEFISRSLSVLPDREKHCLMARTGDGAIVLFERAEDAHHFACSVQALAKEHNDRRSEKTAKRCFRIGLATGEVQKDSCVESADEYAGMTIATAVRLETAAASGEIVIDAASFAELPVEARGCYGKEEIVRGKRNETFRARRCHVSKSAAVRPARDAPRWTRRQVIGVGAGVAGAVAVGGWLEWPAIDRRLHPLPQKRFVALMPWPPPDPEQAPLVASVLDTIHARLSRAEMYVKDLLILGSEEMKDSAQGMPQNGKDGPREVAEWLGANLILAAQMTVDGNAVVLSLHLLDAGASHILRKAQLRVKSEKQGSLNQVAWESAARLLDLSIAERTISDEQELASVSGPAREAFLRGEEFRQDPNNSKIAEATESYQRSLVANPKFALAHAELASAYRAGYGKTHDRATLDLARSNVRMALKLNPDSERAQLTQADVSLLRGETDQALSAVTRLLERDPDNVEALFRKARVFKQSGRPKEEEAMYRQVIRLRPNYWRAYNDLGAFLRDKARYDEAAECFKTASVIAPRVALPLANLGAVYITQRKREEAVLVLKRSLDLFESEEVCADLGDLSFEAKGYAAARDYYLRALQLAPKEDYLWGNLGDSYEMLGDRRKVADSYGKAAETLSELLGTNPKDGLKWMTLAFYQAKIGQVQKAETSIAQAERRGATDVNSMFTKARALALLGREEEAKELVLKCLDKGLSPVEVELALELKDVRSSSEYASRAATLKSSQAP